MAKESTILIGCKKRLEYWKSMKVVCHFDRINSGKIFTGQYWVQLAEKGSPDLVAYINNNNICALLFIECKKPGGRLRDSQIEFMMKFKDLTNVYYEIVTDPNQIDITINKITNFAENQLSKVNL